MTDLNKELMMAQINKLNAKTDNIQSTSELNNTKIQAEMLKLIAETQKIQAEAKYYPYVVAGGLGGLVGAILSLIVKAI